MLEVFSSLAPHKYFSSAQSIKLCIAGAFSTKQEADLFILYSLLPKNDESRRIQQTTQPITNKPPNQHIIVHLVYYIAQVYYIAPGRLVMDPKMLSEGAFLISSGLCVRLAILRKRRGAEVVLAIPAP